MTSTTGSDPFGAHSTLATASGDVTFYRLGALEDAGFKPDLVPVTVKIFLENLMRMVVGGFAAADSVSALSMWGQKPLEDQEFPYAPARVILQDFTGVPTAVDLAAMRSALAREGGDPSKVDPLVPVDLVIDHSVQVDAFGSARAFTVNVEREYERNHERYSLLRWAQGAFHGFRVVPPGMGIVHQVNLENLATVVRTVSEDGNEVAVPDTLVGTDSHTTMINGLGVLGWGVGGIEAEAALLGQPLPLVTPKVVGFRFSGSLATGVTATDLVLTVTEMLREHGIVGKFVEFYGEGLSNLTVADRATLSNMSPEYGATAAYFPIDEQTLTYLELTGRDEGTVDLVERYAKEQQMFRTNESPDPEFTEALELDLSDVEPSVAGPRRPQDRVSLTNVWKSFTDVYDNGDTDMSKGVEIQEARWTGEGGTDRLSDRDVDAGAGPPEGPETSSTPAGEQDASAGEQGGTFSLRHGSVVIAAITSCTNTSNPSVMLAAGLLAKKAVERGLATKRWVKTSMAPGSRVVTQYLQSSGLITPLEELGFHIVGYGCTTCIGNSGPLPAPISAAIDEHDLAVVSVLSGNRNFEGRIHPQVKASYLASPPLVVAYALAGSADIDLTTEPLGRDRNDEPVHLKDIWPTPEEITEAMKSVETRMFKEEYAKVFDGDEHWAELPSPTGDLYDWDPDSTYVREPPFFEELGTEPDPLEDISGARVLALLGDSVTTDHISPAGSIAPASPAGAYLKEHGVDVKDFNSYGSRRGNHDVMVRGTFANIRIRNRLVPSGKEGGFSVYLGGSQAENGGEELPIYEVAKRYLDEGTALVVIAGKEYGSGSSRDWAAKGPSLLGVRAVFAESFERIHRSNLVGMGVLPLQFIGGDNAESLSLDGSETFLVSGIAEGLEPHAELPVVARRDNGEDIEFSVECRIDSDVELDYYRHGGVLQMVLRRMLAES